MWTKPILIFSQKDRLILRIFHSPQKCNSPTQLSFLSSRTCRGRIAWLAMLTRVSCPLVSRSTGSASLTHLCLCCCWQHFWPSFSWGCSRTTCPDTWSLMKKQWRKKRYGHFDTKYSIVVMLQTVLTFFLSNIHQLYMCSWFVLNSLDGSWFMVMFSDFLSTRVCFVQQLEQGCSSSLPPCLCFYCAWRGLFQRPSVDLWCPALLFYTASTLQLADLSQLGCTAKWMARVGWTASFSRWLSSLFPLWLYFCGWTQLH